MEKKIKPVRILFKGSGTNHHSGRSNRIPKYEFCPGQPVLITDPIDIKFFTGKAEKNPQEWEVFTVIDEAKSVVEKVKEVFKSPSPPPEPEPAPEPAPVVEPKEPVEVPEKPDYDIMKKADLVDLCKERGLDTGGTKKKLIKRLKESD